MPISTPNPTTGKLPIRDILPALLTLLALAAALKLQGHDYSFRWLLLALLLLSSLLAGKIIAGYRRSLTLPMNGPIAAYALFFLWASLSLL